MEGGVGEQILGKVLEQTDKQILGKVLEQTAAKSSATGDRTICTILVASFPFLIL